MTNTPPISVAFLGVKSFIFDSFSNVIAIATIAKLSDITDNGSTNPTSLKAIPIANTPKDMRIINLTPSTTLFFDFLSDVFSKIPPSFPFLAALTSDNISFVLLSIFPVVLTNVLISSDIDFSFAPSIPAAMSFTALPPFLFCFFNKSTKFSKASVKFCRLSINSFSILEGII